MPEEGTGTTGEAAEGRVPNLLIHEKSPYLLQHAFNPVAWRPWSDEAFAAARDLDRPVFISIGYATCHWCHVMEHESFEDQNVAAFLNDNFICIKVDREERPDVDSIYMDVCQAMTGHGGWPLTIFADADRLPYFAGTYFPRESRGNRLGFLDLVMRIRNAWDTDRDNIKDSAQEVLKMLQEGATASFRADVPDTIFTTVAEHHRRTFDDSYGGFGVQPKFPSPHHLLLLFRIARRAQNASADASGGSTDLAGGNADLTRLAMKTLDAMRAGGIYDHVGFGFHRYSTDREWLLPHFEKMLYDQAMLMMAYTEAWQISGNDVYKRVCEEIADYLRRDMTSAEGAFFSAQDADSEGVEGKYYVWSHEELSLVLSTDQLAWLEQNMAVRTNGNFHDEATGEPSGLNILHGKPTRSTTDNKEQNADHGTWQQIRTTLLAHRYKRVPPLTDDKILTDWNGLMIAALAKAGRAFGNATGSEDSNSDRTATKFTAMAESAYAAVQQLCGGESWVHRYRDEERAVKALLDDHAAMGYAALELYQTTGRINYLNDAQLHARTILDTFVTNDGSLARTAVDVSDIPIRVREAFDSAYPSGNSIAAMLFTGLGVILNDNTFRDAARACVVTYGKQVARYGPAHCMLLCAWDTLVHGSTEIVLNDKVTSDNASLLAPSPSLLALGFSLLASSFLPNAYFIHNPAEHDQLRAIYPTESAPMPSILVCSNYACHRPFTTEQDVVDYLSGTVQ